MAFIMSMKEDSELKIIKRACDITVDVFGKYLKDQVMEIIDADKVRPRDMAWRLWTRSVSACFGYCHVVE